MENTEKLKYFKFAIFFSFLLAIIFILFELLGRDASIIYSNSFFVPVLALILIVTATVLQMRKGDIAPSTVSNGSFLKTYLKGPLLFGFFLFGILMSTLIVYLVVRWVYKLLTGS